MASTSVMRSFPLHAAAKADHINKLKEALAAGADVNSLDDHGFTALSLATEFGRLGLVKVLLSAGADPSLACTADGGFPLYLAAQTNNLKVAKLLVDAGADLNAVVGCDFGGTALIKAIDLGHAEFIRFLIEAGCDVDKTDVNCVSPLANASVREQKEITSMLLAAGANVNARGPLGMTPLHASVSSNVYGSVVHLIKNGANVNAVDGNDRSILHYAAEGGLDSILKALIRAGADVNKKIGRLLLTPLHLACRCGHFKCVRSLLYAGASVSAVDRAGMTPLHYTAEFGQVEVVELLLSAGAEVRTLDSDERTPLIIACLKGHAKAVSLLLDAGSDPNRLLKDGMNAVFAATNLETVMVLLERGAPATVVNEQRSTTLHYAGTRGLDGKGICALFKAGANPTLLDNCGRTAADDAREKGHEDTAKLLDLLAAKYRATA